MSEEASTATEHPVEESLKKEAVDALAQLKSSDIRETFDYFQALVNFQKHATHPERS